MLDPSIRKSHRVATFTHTSSIIRLCSLEVGVGVVISNSIVVCVGRHLSSMGYNRGVVSCYRGSVNYGGSMSINRGSMSNDRSSMSNYWASILSRDGYYQTGNINKDLHPETLLFNCPH